MNAYKYQYHHNKNVSQVLIRHLVVDAYRLPFTVGRVVAANATTVSFELENSSTAEGRDGTYVWDTAVYPWLETTFASAIVPPGRHFWRWLSVCMGAPIVAQSQNVVTLES